MNIDDDRSSTDSTNAEKWNVLQRAVEERSVKTAFALFRRHGIEPILIKGWAAGRNYPIDKFRASTDIDIAVSAKEYDRALKLAKSDESKGLNLDIHRELRHLDTVSWNEIVGRSELVDIGDAKVRVPSAEDHLRILCVHWLTDGGWFRERLWDIYYAVENRPDDFYWEVCLGAVSPNRRRWVVCTIGVAHRYLGLNIDELPFRDEAADVPRWLIRAVEKEWASSVRLLPLHDFVNKPADLIRQIRKRLPPNPISSTVDVEGSFDARFRFHYQVGSMLKRLGPSVPRLWRQIFRR